MPDARDAVTLVEILEVVGDFDEAVALISTTVARLEREGVPGLASMQFYTHAERRELAAVITFADPAQMQAHTAMISSWDAFRRFSEVVRFKEMRIHGVVGPEVKAWLARFPGPVAQYDSPIAAFFRRPAPVG